MTKKRTCPICGNRKYILFAEQKIDQGKLNKYSYASRKQPEFMCHQLVRCTECDCIYAPTPPKDAHLAQAYAEADYDSSKEACYAAESYASALKPYIVAMHKRGVAIDVGAGNGALLPHLDQMGFEEVYGVEPSSSAIQTAPPELRPQLIEGVFTPGMLADKPLSLLCSFQTLEHIPDPMTLLKDAATRLHPGGMIALITHDYTGTLNRILGLRSPIIDIEHIQLYCPTTIVWALDACGFTNIEVKPIWNRYPLQYWLRLFPLPSSVKQTLQRYLSVVHLADKAISLPVGNILTIAYKA